MNKEIFKLEELLKKSEIPFYFNYSEENRPTPFGTVPAEFSNELLYVAVGPVMRRNDLEAVVVSLEGATEDALLKIRLSDDDSCREIGQQTAEQAFKIINEEFLKHRAEWWPEVYEK